MGIVTSHSYDIVRLFYFIRGKIRISIRIIEDSISIPICIAHSVCIYNSFGMVDIFITFRRFPRFAPIMHQHSLFRDIIVFIVLNLQIIDLDKGRENYLILNDNDGIIFQLESVIDSICF